MCVCVPVQTGCVSYDNLAEDDIIEQLSQKIKSSTALPRGCENTVQDAATVHDTVPRISAGRSVNAAILQCKILHYKYKLKTL